MIPVLYKFSFEKKRNKLHVPRSLILKRPLILNFLYPSPSVITINHSFCISLPNNLSFFFCLSFYIFYVQNILDELHKSTSKMMIFYLQTYLLLIKTVFNSKECILADVIRMNIRLTLKLERNKLR